MCDLLIQRGADVNVVSDKWGTTALTTAAKGGHLELVKMLIHHGADLDVQDGKGRPALIHAVRAGFADVAVLLFQKGANMDLKDSGGKGVWEHARELSDDSVLNALTAAASVQVPDAGAGP